MNKTVIRIPPSPLYDMEAMESWLTDMAREGLYLERQGIYWGLGHLPGGTSGTALPAGVLSRTPHPVAASTAKPPRPQPGGQGTGRPGRVGICLPPPILLRLPGHHRASPGDGNRPPASGRGHPSGIVVVQYGRILHYFREMSQKLALGDAINHRKPWRAQTKRRLAIRWTIVGMVIVFGVGIFPSGTVSLPPPPAPDYPFATVSDLLPAGYAYQREPENFSFQRRPNPFFPQDLLWMEDGTLTTPDGRTCQVGFRLQYTRTALLSAAQWCFQTAWEELIAQGRVHAESLALPGLDQAKLVQDAFGSCLLLRQGTQVWRVSLNHMEDGVWPPALWQEAVLRSLGITVPA